MSINAPRRPARPPMCARPRARFSARGLPRVVYPVCCRCCAFSVRGSIGSRSGPTADGRGRPAVWQWREQARCCASP
eukprot:11219195-Lingulodinium_polyedra.AAC.1